MLRPGALFLSPSSLNHPTTRETPNLALSSSNSARIAPSPRHHYFLLKADFPAKRLQIIHLIHFAGHKFLNFPILLPFFFARGKERALAGEAFPTQALPINRRAKRARDVCVRLRVGWRRKFPNCLLLLRARRCHRLCIYFYFYTRTARICHNAKKHAALPRARVEKGGGRDRVAFLLRNRSPAGRTAPPFQ